MSSTLDSYTSAMDDLCFSDDAKARMTANIAAATAGASAASEAAASANNAEVIAFPAHRKRARPWAKAAAAVAIVLALAIAGTTAAVAAGVLPKPSDILSDLFVETPSRTEIIDSIGRPLDASCSSNGVTITAKAIIGDRYNCDIVFDISKDDGSSFDVEALDSGILALMVEGNFYIDGMLNSHGGARFYDADPDDTSIQYVVSLSSMMLDGKSVIGRTARFHLDRILDLSGDDAETLIEGDWNLKFKMNYGDTTLDLVCFEGETTKLGDWEATVESVSISSIGYSVTYTVDGVVEPSGKNGKMTKEGQERLDTLLEMPIELDVDDTDLGMRIDVTKAGGEIVSAENGKTRVTKSGEWGNVIDTSNIHWIKVGDKTAHRDELPL